MRAMTGEPQFQFLTLVWTK